MKYLCSIFLSLFLFLTFSTGVIAKEKVKGTWKYEANGVPGEYATGEIIISKKGKVYSVSLNTNYDNITATKVNVDKNKVNFNVYVADMNVSVTLNINGDKMKGEAVTYDGTIPISGERKK